MKRKVRQDDPLHDGSLGSYLLRFGVGFVLGIFADVILAAMIWGYHWFFSSPSDVPHIQYIWLAIPLIFAVVAVFKFDWIVRLYDELVDTYVRDRI